MVTSKTPSKKRDRVPATQRVEAHLRKTILAGKLRRRQRIIEADIANELGVSRGPVREAILCLERDGLVVNTSRRGTFIHDISLTEIDVIFRMRTKLEALCVHYMRRNANIDAAGLLNRMLQRLKIAADKNSVERVFRADMELHRTIWRAANQPLLYRTLNLIMTPYIFIIGRANSARFPMNVLCKNHEQYVRLVLKTPLDKVEVEVERYFNALHSELLGQRAPFLEFFT